VAAAPEAATTLPATPGAPLSPLGW
jgi:hypothetical protein